MGDIALTREQKAWAVRETVRGTLAWPAVAKGTITLTDLPVADEYFYIGSQKFTFKALRAAAGQVTIGATAAACCTNIITAVNTDLPTLVVASQGTGTTVVITAKYFGRQGNYIAFTEDATNLTIDGTGYLGATQAGAGDPIIVAGDPDINQQPSFTDSPEILNTHDIIDRSVDSFPAGDWSCPILLRPSGTAGIAPAADCLFETLLGKKTVNAGTSVVYSPALEKPSFSLWIQKGHTVFGMSGCTPTQAKFSLTPKGYILLDVSGQGMREIKAGKSTLSANEAAAQTELSITSAKRFDLHTRVWNVTKDDSNSGAGYEVTARTISTDGLSDTITISPAVPVGGWAKDDVIQGWVPVVQKIGTALEARGTGVKFNSIATTIKSLDVTIATPVKFTDDEIPADGEDCPTDYIEDGRTVSLDLKLNFRSANLDLFHDSLNHEEPAVDLSFGSVAGSKLDISMPRNSLEVPKVSSSKPTVELSVAGKALGTVGEDSISLTFS